MKYHNPVIPGCYPDPSICSADGKYYLVCSSFQFFPGVPLFESTDLVNWTQIGHVLTRESQLPLRNADSVGGIYAPTIRFDNGRFYMVTTNVTNGGHFYVWTDDIHGEWSEPVWVDQQGIDPSLFFEDGKAYFMSNGNDTAGRACILQCEIDISTGKALSPVREIWHGTGGRFLESPHLYHIGQYYYLMASEGGTEYGHMVVYARSNSLWGPFEPYAANPVLTNRNLGGYQLQGAGHADLVQDTQGNWWMVHLAFRQIHQWMMHHITGREVCLVPVTFDADGWFTAGADGTCRLEMETDRIPETVTQQIVQGASFADPMQWVWLQNPHEAQYTRSADCFTLRGTAVAVDAKNDSPTWIGTRQRENAFSLTVTLTRSRQNAGVSVYMGADQHYDLYLHPTETGWEIVRRCVLGLLEQKQTAQMDGTAPVTLHISCNGMAYQFAASSGTQEADLGALESKYLSTETAGNFTGICLGLFADSPCADGAQTDFTDFRLEYK